MITCKNPASDNYHKPDTTFERMRSILCWPWKAYPMSYHQSPKAIPFTKANLILHRECSNEKCRMSSALHVQSHWRQSSPWTLDEVSNFIHTAFFVTFASLGHERCDYYDVSIIIFLTDRSTKVWIIRVWKCSKPKFDIKSVKTIWLQMILSNLKKLAFLLNNKLRAIAVPILFR